MKNKRLIILLVIAILLFIPLITMQFTASVNWNLTDFIVAASLLLTTGLLIELVLRKVKNRKFQLAIGISLILLFLLVWAELAVGVFGTALSGN